MHDFKSFIIKLLIDIIIVWAVLLWIIAAFMGTKAHAGSEWNEWTQKKHENLVSIWFSKQMSTDIINGCKKSQKDPVKCIKILASIMWAESSMGTRCYRNNCLGMNDGAVAYSSVIEWINAWVNKFDRWWYKQKDPSGFYRADWIPPKTHYCMWKKKDWVCKEGTKNSWNVWNKLNF